MKIFQTQNEKNSRPKREMVKLKDFQKRKHNTIDIEELLQRNVWQQNEIFKTHCYDYFELKYQQKVHQYVYSVKLIYIIDSNRKSLHVELVFVV
jgi:hypothetical protein